MSTWLEGGRSAIQEALAAAYDRIDENAKTGMWLLPGVSFSQGLC